MTNDQSKTTASAPLGYKDSWADVAMVEREIRLLAFTRSADAKMFAIWSGRLQKAINDAAA